MVTSRCRLAARFDGSGPEAARGGPGEFERIQVVHVGRAHDEVVAVLSRSDLEFVGDGDPVIGEVSVGVVARTAGSSWILCEFAEDCEKPLVVTQPQDELVDGDLTL